MLIFLLLLAMSTHCICVGRLVRSGKNLRSCLTIMVTVQVAFLFFPIGDDGVAAVRAAAFLASTIFSVLIYARLLPAGYLEVKGGAASLAFVGRSLSLSLLLAVSGVIVIAIFHGPSAINPLVISLAVLSPFLVEPALSLNASVSVGPSPDISNVIALNAAQIFLGLVLVGAFFASVKDLRKTSTVPYS